MTLDVVTGGAGFVGSHLVDSLLSAGRRVLVIDDLSVGRLTNLEAHRDHPGFSFVQADVADKPAMLRLLDGAERVFHLAARADIVPAPLFV